MSDRACPGILVVDDQPDMRALLQTILRHHGFRVVLAASGREALPIFRVKQDDIALVLLNAAMPEWDGPRTLQELRKVCPDVVACFVAGASQNHADANLEALGVAAVIRKPFEPSELARVLWGVVGVGDRRDAPRAMTQSTRVTVGSGLEPQHLVESYVGDQSPEGIRLRLPQKLGEVGAILSIRPADVGDESPWLPVQVRHVRKRACGPSAVSSCILQPASADDVTRRRAASATVGPSTGPT